MESSFSINESRKPDQSQWEKSTTLLTKKEQVIEDSLFGEGLKKETKATQSSSKKSAPKKVVVEIEQRFTPIRSGRGGDRGGRGGYSGERGRGGTRGRGRDERGGRGRGGRGGRGAADTIDVADTTAFPALS